MSEEEVEEEETFDDIYADTLVQLQKDRQTMRTYNLISAERIRRMGLRNAQRQERELTQRIEALKKKAAEEKKKVLQRKRRRSQVESSSSSSSDDGEHVPEEKDEQLEQTPRGTKTSSKKKSSVSKRSKHTTTTTSKPKSTTHTGRKRRQRQKQKQTTTTTTTTTTRQSGRKRRRSDTNIEAHGDKQRPPRKVSRISGELAKDIDRQQDEEYEQYKRSQKAKKRQQRKKLKQIAKQKKQIGAASKVTDELQIEQAEKIHTLEDVKAGISDGTFKRITKSEYDQNIVGPKIDLSSRKPSYIWKYFTNVVYANTLQPVLSNLRSGKSRKRWVYCHKCNKYAELVGM